MMNIQKGLAELESIDLRDKNASQQIDQIIIERFKKLPSFQCNFADNSAIIRTRKLDENLDFFHNIEDYSYNSDIDKIKIGRANYEKQPIFYGSTDRITSLAEVRLLYNNGDEETSRYVISRWDIISPLQLTVVIDPIKVLKHQAPELIGIAKFIEKCQNDFKDDDEISDFIEIYKYFSAKFAEPVKQGEEYKYKLTAGFSNFIYSKLKTCDGIIYQSVQYPLKFNVALKSDAIDNGKLKLTFAARQTFKMTGHLEFEEIESVHTQGFDYDSGKILW
jgi:hypothetical protein